MKKIGIIISPGFEEIEAITPIDILRRSGLEVITLGIGSKSVKGSHNIVIETDFLIDDYIDVDDLEGIVIPGGMPGATNIVNSTAAIKIVEKTYNKNCLVAAICASPGVVLGPLGLLVNRDFTCYPSFEDRVEGGIFLEQSVVVSDNIITSRGPGTAMEFSLAIVSYLISKEKADIISTALLFPRIS